MQGFQASAFQDDAFQVEDVAPPTPTGARRPVFIPVPPYRPDDEETLAALGLT